MNKHLQEQYFSIGFRSSAADEPPLKMNIEQRASRPVSVVHEDSIAAIEKLERARADLCHKIKISFGLLSASLNWIL